MRNIQIDGRLKADAEVRTSKGGTPYLFFEIANSTYEKGDYVTTWYSVFSYDEVLRKRAAGFRKGSYVYVSGAYSVEAVERGRVYLNHSINAHEVELLYGGTKKADGNGADANNGNDITVPPLRELAPQQAAPQVRENIIPNKITTEQFNEPTIPLPTPTSSGVSDDEDLPF